MLENFLYIWNSQYTFSISHNNFSTSIWANIQSINNEIL